MPLSVVNASLIRCRLACCAVQGGHLIYAQYAKLCPGCSSETHRMRAALRAVPTTSNFYGIQFIRAASTAQAVRKEQLEDKDEPSENSIVVSGKPATPVDTAAVLRRVGSLRRSTSSAGSHDDPEQSNTQAGEPLGLQEEGVKRSVHPSAYLLFALERVGKRDAFLGSLRRPANPFSGPASSDHSPQAILARHILNHATAKARPGPALSSHDEQSLRLRGYSILDLEKWTSTIFAEDNGVTVRKAFERPRDGQEPIPIFLFMLHLRRRHVNAKTLQCFLHYAWQRLGVYGTHQTIAPSDSSSEVHSYEGMSSLDESTVFAMFYHLLRHARKVWPQAVENIARIVSMYLHQKGQSEAQEGLFRSRELSQMNRFCNRALVLLGEPTSLGRVRSTVYLETAQFDILHAMASHRPPLRIGHDAYKAVIRILLARPKTEREQDWASIQAKSWPPWKRDQTGIDEAKDVTYGFSRAVIAIHQMMQAGYGSYYWRRIAKLYGGWDVDGSPTVQTRTLLSPSTEVCENNEASGLWEARIKTTRTTREAWACFLSYKASKCEPSEAVYMAMITKLLLGNKTAARRATEAASSERIQNESYSGRDAYGVQAGDALEPLPEPTYPGDITFVPSDPPLALDLFQEMLAKGVGLSHHAVAGMVRRARTIDEGTIFLETAGVPFSDYTQILTSGDELDSAMVQSIPHSVFAGFILLLCRLPRSPLRLARTRSSQRSRDQASNWSLRRESPILHAVRLLTLRQYNARDLWVALLAALSDDEAPLAFASHMGKGERQSHTKLRLMGDVLWNMRQNGIEPDTAALRAISVGMENACLAQHRPAMPNLAEQPSLTWAIAVDRLSDVLGKSDVARSEQGQIENGTAQTAMQASRSLRVLFRSIVAGDETTDIASSRNWVSRTVSPMIPRLLAVPNAAELHAYVRALGVLGDHEGIWSLVQWMADHHAALIRQFAEERGGRLHRWTILLTSVRVFLECPERDGKVATAIQAKDIVPASQELVSLVRQRIESVPEWVDDWPSEVAMQQYLANG